MPARLTAQWRQLITILAPVGGFVLVIAPFVVALAAGRGFWLLLDMISWPWKGMVLAAALLLLALRLIGELGARRSQRPPTKWRLGRPCVWLRSAAPKVARAVGALLVPILALLGANWFWAERAEGWDLAASEPLIGLGIAAAFVGLTVWVYLTSWWVAESPDKRGVWVVSVLMVVVFLPVAWGIKQHPEPFVGALIAGLFVGVVSWMYLHSPWIASVSWARGRWLAGLVLLPLLVLPALGIKDAIDRVLAEEELVGDQLVSELDVIVIGDGPKAPKVPRAGEAGGWDINYWAGSAQGMTVRWNPEGAPALRDGADSVLLLDIDGAAQETFVEAAAVPDPVRDERELKAEVERWLAIAAEVAPDGTPTLALLRSAQEKRLQAWKRLVLAPARSDRQVSPGDVISVKELDHPVTIGDLALSGAASGPTGEEDLALAMRHRPALFFDTEEAYARPLNIDSLLASGELRLCPNDQPTLALCSEIRGAGDLSNGPNHLGFMTDNLAAATSDTTIYVHVVRHEDLIYLDYWWYFPDNPTWAAGGALCGAGFVIAEVTCFDHQSDWEGVTVVVDPTPPSSGHQSPAPGSLPVAVHYAAHKGTVRYSWPTLQEFWRIPGKLPEGPKALEAMTHVDTTFRPFVFVAHGTHAAYPTACRKPPCAIPGAPIEENSHDGEKPWLGNNEPCAGDCLAALPTRNQGKSPALWNAYDGPWGTAKCDLWFFCSGSNSPLSPSQQSRYKKPWCAKLPKNEPGLAAVGTCPSERSTG